jgi:hypothetical protein
MWNGFFASWLGKGVMDGIGGTVKRAVYSEIKGGKCIANAEQFAHVAKERMPRCQGDKIQKN